MAKRRKLLIKSLEIFITATYNKPDSEHTGIISGSGKGGINV